MKKGKHHSKETKEKIGKKMSLRLLKEWQDPNSIFNSKKYREKLRRKMLNNKIWLGRKHNKTTLDLMSKIKKGKKNPFWKKHHTLFHNKKISKISKNLWKDPNFKKKVVISLKKAWQNPNLKKKVKTIGKNNGMFGKTHSKKTRNKISIKLKNVYDKSDCFWKSKNYKKKRKQIAKKLWKQKRYKNKVLKSKSLGLTMRPTLPEMRLIQIIKINRLPFYYVGDWKFTLNGFCPDFVNRNHNLILEVYGEYWHNLSKVKKRDKKRLEVYSSLGYKTLIIWSKELENPQKVTENIINFITQ